MDSNIHVSEFDTFFVPNRTTTQFLRVISFNPEVQASIKKYYMEAVHAGVVIEGELQNPTPQQLTYYNEIMPSGFKLDVGFISDSLRVWLPRMNSTPRTRMSEAIYDVLTGLRKKGKTESILQNAYIKIMCWLYYKFERISNRIGSTVPPKILCEATPGMYQLALLSVLHKAGCDIVWLMYAGDSEYLKYDPASKLSTLAVPTCTDRFPENFSLKTLRQEVQAEEQKRLLYGAPASWNVCSNTWIADDTPWIEVIKTQAIDRDAQPQEIHSCAFQICGVEDKKTYVPDLYQMYATIKSSGRRIVVLDKAPEISVEAINAIRRDKYQTKEQMISSLVGNFRSSNHELQSLMRKAFVDTLTSPEMVSTSMEKLTGIAVYLICWMQKYQSPLFDGWKPPEVPCLVRMGESKDQKEQLFYEMLCRLPVDVLLLTPHATEANYFGQGIKVISYKNTLPITRFPKDAADVQSGTVAYHAERDLDTLLYQGTGLYRNQQYSKARSIVLQTTYEEIPILWDQELNFRPNFTVEGDVVILPTIFAKVSGVKDGDVAAYWASIKQLVTPDTLFIERVPFIRREDDNPIKPCATHFWRNNRLQRTAIKQNPVYQYRFLREPIQDYILDNLEQFIVSKLVRGTFETGSEYIILSTVLNFKKEILQLLNKFDFTKRNPKIIYAVTGENGLSLEDAIMTSFLNRLGFDVLVFAPTGYQCFEQYFNSPICEEHQIGGYMYNLVPPKMSEIPLAANKGWRERLKNFVERI